MSPNALSLTPKSISVDAQAALESVHWALPPLPEPDDKPAWRDLVEKFNANLAETIREQVMPILGRAALETIAGVPVYVAEPESIPSGNRDKAVIFFHCGGLVMGGGEAVGLFARLEAFKTSCRVYAVDFGNPPEHVHEALLLLGLDGEAVDQGYYVSFSGDGGHLALLCFGISRPSILGRRFGEAAIRFLSERARSTAWSWRSRGPHTALRVRLSASGSQKVA